MEDKKIEHLFEKFSEKIDVRLDKNSKELRNDFNNQGKFLTKELKEDYARQGQFLLEQFEKRTQIIAEVVKSNSNKLDATFEMVGKLAEDMDIVKGEVRTIRNSLARKVDYEESENLEKRVVYLEKKLQKA